MSNTQASGALYYLVHSTLIGAAFYLFCGWITSQRGDFKDHLKVALKNQTRKSGYADLFLDCDDDGRFTTF